MSALEVLVHKMVQRSVVHVDDTKHEGKRKGAAVRGSSESTSARSGQGHENYSLEAITISSRLEESSKVASMLQPPNLSTKGRISILVLFGKLVQAKRIGDERLGLERFFPCFGA